jgi:hypothetical protein
MPEEWYGIFVDGPAGVTEYSDMPQRASGGHLKKTASPLLNASSDAP